MTHELFVDTDRKNPENESINLSSRKGAMTTVTLNYNNPDGATVELSTNT